ncbi:hypothetical protein ABDK09_18805 [Vibrio sp. CDRSL-10 TSBA]
MLAIGESGPRNIGLSKVIDPLGVTITSATEQDGLVISVINKERIEYARSILPALENRRFDKPELIQL